MKKKNKNFVEYLIKRIEFYKAQKGDYLSVILALENATILLEYIKKDIEVLK